MKCPYQYKCTSEGIACSTCVHNADKKEDYYEPEREYPRPWPREEPWYPERRHIWYY